jgi:5-methylcytosine-specific restriction endonuclease McrA
MAERASMKMASSGHVGVYFHAQTGKWQAQITRNRKCKSLGLFWTKEEAVAARSAAVAHHPPSLVPSPSLETSCCNCGKIYLEYQSRLEKSLRHFCGQACYNADKSGSGNPNFRDAVETISCSQCGSPFQAWKNRDNRVGRRNGLYCSLACKHTGIRIYASKKEARRESRRRREFRQKSAAFDGHHTKAEWLELLSRYGGRCARCRSRKRIERDHIIPISKGGSDRIENIQPLCKSCNCRKNNVRDMLL